MTDTNDATVDSTTSPEASGSATTPAQAGTAGEDPVASARRRQAGAEAARQEAERKLAEATRELTTLRSQTQTAQQAELSELERLKAQLAVEKQRADEAEAKATAKVLDARFPNARRELPEVTDEVKLARFEAMLAEAASEEAEPPTPRGTNGPTRTASRQPAPPPTIESVEAELRQIGVPWARPQ